MKSMFQGCQTPVGEKRLAVPAHGRPRGRPSWAYAASCVVVMTLRVWLLLRQVSDTLVRFASYEEHVPRVSDTGGGKRSRYQALPVLIVN